MAYRDSRGPDNQFSRPRRVVARPASAYSFKAILAKDPVDPNRRATDADDPFSNKAQLKSLDRVRRGGDFYFAGSPDCRRLSPHRDPSWIVLDGGPDPLA